MNNKLLSGTEFLREKENEAEKVKLINKVEEIEFINEELINIADKVEEINNKSTLNTKEINRDLLDLNKIFSELDNTLLRLKKLQKYLNIQIPKIREDLNNKSDLMSFLKEEETEDQSREIREAIKEIVSLEKEKDLKNQITKSIEVAGDLIESVEITREKLETELENINKKKENLEKIIFKIHSNKNHFKRKNDSLERNPKNSKQTKRQK